MESWNSLEVVKLLVGILNPIALLIIGWFINKRLKKVEQSQWLNQKMIEKRLEIYDKLAPSFNDLFCFYTNVGN